MEKDISKVHTHEELDQLLDNSKLFITDTFAEPPEVIKVGDSVIATLGNFSASTGKAKSKKTFNISALVASALSKTPILMYKTSLPASKNKILYIDTEQSACHCLKVMKRIFRLAGLPMTKHPDNLEFLMLRMYPPEKRLAMIEREIYKADDIGLVIIDGIRDLAYDINSPSEATTLISRLMKWTDERKIHIHTVLHQNKTDDNSRGHLGTELNNKAETVLQVVKDNDNKELSVVSAVHIRDIEFEPFAFTINADALPELVDDYESNSPASPKKFFSYTELSADEHRKALDIAFKDEKEQGYAELMESLQRGYAAIGYNYGTNKIKQLKVFLSNKQMVYQRAKRYSYNPDFYY